MPRSIAVSAFFLDFDGVLVDSVSMKKEAFRSIIAPYAGSRLDDCMSYFMLNGGTSRRTKFQHVWTKVLGHPLDPDLIDRLAGEFSRRVFDLTCQAAYIPGAQEFLEEYNGQVPLFVISGTPEEELRRVVNARHMQKYFRGVCGSPPTKVQIGNRLVSEYQFDRSCVWFVGDATTDRDAARALDVNFVGVDGPHLRPYLDGTETMISDLSELAGAVYGSAITP